MLKINETIDRENLHGHTANDPVASALGPTDPNLVFTTWDTRTSAVVQKHFRPTSLDQLVGIVRAAASQVPNVPVRAVGSGWSFSDAAVPGFGDAPGYLVETGALHRALPVPASGSSERLVHVEAGIRLVDLNVMLDSWKPDALALPTMGGSAGQTLAGAISTGTHGGDVRLQPLADLVRAIQLVGPDGTVYWIGRTQDQAIQTKAQVQATFPHLELANIIQDDQWFDSVLVSMGSMGIIYSLVLAVCPAFLLAQTVQISTWSQVRAQLPVGSAATGSRFLEVNLTPNFAETDRPHPFDIFYPGERGDRVCQVVQRDVATDVSPSGAPGCDFGTWFGNYAMEDARGFVMFFSTFVLGLPDIPFVPGFNQELSAEIAAASVNLPNELPMLEALFRLVAIAKRHLAFWILPEVEKRLLQLGASPRKAGVGKSFEVMTSDTATLLKTYATPPIIQTPLVDSLEIFLDATTPAYLTSIDQILDIIQGYGVFGGYVALRFMQPTRAYLGMQQAALTCSVEVTLFQALGSNDALFASLQDFALDPRVGGRLHWGQRNERLRAPRVSALYPDLPAWLAVRAQLTRNGALTTFDSQFTARCGLSGSTSSTSSTTTNGGGGSVKTVGKHGDDDSHEHHDPLGHYVNGGG
jgi:hypothetical protein